MKAAYRRSLLGSTALATVMTVVAVGASQAQQAVAYPNGMLGGFAGSNDGNGFAAGEGLWATPLGPVTGAQIDGYAGIMGSKPMAQVAGHLFWRDPQTSLLGIYGAWTSQFDKSTFRIGPEAEFYAGPFTFSGVGGVETGDDTTGGFFQGKLSYYATPDTKIYGGGGYDGHGFGLVGLEHQFQGSGWTGFGEARFGDVTSVWAGLRYYFGAPGKSLEARDREDVAPLWKFMAKEPSTMTSPSTTATSTSS
jgi:hypothetical protein